MKSGAGSPTSRADAGELARELTSNRVVKRNRMRILKP
jgi:hypothetical protein